MARRSKNKVADEIEVVFGFKQVLGVIALSVAALGLAYLAGVESGHKRAQRGEPSLLAFLQQEADTHTEPVEIPDILFEQLEVERAQIKAASDAEQSANNGQPGPSSERVRPTAAVRPQPTSVEQPTSTVGAENKPAAVPVSALPPASTATGPQSGQGRQLHYQVAALNSHKNAKGLVDWLRAQGFPGRITVAHEDGLYRVVVGPFRNDMEAESAKIRLAQDGFAVMVRKL